LTRGCIRGKQPTRTADFRRGQDGRSETRGEERSDWDWKRGEDPRPDRGDRDWKAVRSEATGTGVIARDQLKSIVERIERLEEEKQALADDIKEVYGEAKANGFDTKTLRTESSSANRTPPSGRRPRRCSTCTCRRSGCSPRRVRKGRQAVPTVFQQITC